MSFSGIFYRLADNWFSFIPIKEEPINYLEIGVFYGANLFSVCDTYAKNNLSKVYGIDPWIDYSEYDEYKNEMESIYNQFEKNLNNRNDKHKINIIRGYSWEKIHNLNLEFDIIYIDGNHKPECVLEDAVLAFRKLKIEGYMIFDDYGWGGPDLTQRGIDAFLNSYRDKIKILGLLNSQVFVQKL